MTNHVALDEYHRRSQVLHDFTVDEYGVIQDPGKFEGQMLYVPVFWSYVLDGCGEDDPDDETAAWFDIEESDLAEFPELTGVSKVRLYESDTGFVICECFTQDELADLEASPKSSIRCPDCEMLSINGVPCHETGCPNSRKQWNPETEEWTSEDNL